MQITGSTVSASQALTLTAGNHLLLDAAESSDQRHFRKTTTQTQGLGRKAVANTLDTFSVRQTGTTLSAEHIDLTATQLDESHATRKTSDNLLGFANLSGLLDNGWRQTKESGSFMWQSAKGEGHRTETLRLPDIQAYGASTAAPAIGPQGRVGETSGGDPASLSPTLLAPAHSSSAPPTHHQCQTTKPSTSIKICV